MRKLQECQVFLDKVMLKKTDLSDTFNRSIKEYQSKFILIQKDFSDFIGEIFIKKYLDQKEYINKKYIWQWDESFNLFKIISPKFYNYERLHSEIIGAIFNINTPEIANKKYLEYFIKLLMKKEEKIKNHDFGENYIVKLEESIKIDDRGSIDILIYDDTDAIIIENKIHNARDTENQLAKYYKHVTEIMNKNIIAIVYLPLDPNKNPLLSKYYDGYEIYSQKIKDVLVNLPVISINGQNDFVHGFLVGCCKLAEIMENSTAKVFFEQYMQLLKYLGGNFMALGNEKELFVELFKTKKSISITNDIVNIVENKSFYLKLLFCDSFIESLKEMHFESFEGNSEMRLKIDEELFLVFYHREDEQLAFGFRSEKKIPNEKRKILENLLKENEYTDHFSDILDWGEKWVCKEIKINDFGDVPINETIQFFTKYLLERYASLKEKSINRMK
jgi:uncharacterized protein YrzB (UPF0473 family)